MDAWSNISTITTDRETNSKGQEVVRLMEIAAEEIFATLITFNKLYSAVANAHDH